MNAHAQTLLLTWTAPALAGSGLVVKGWSVPVPPHSGCQNSSENCLAKNSILLLVLWIQTGPRTQGALPSGVRMQPSSRVCPFPCGTRRSLRSLPTQAILWFQERLQPLPTGVKRALVYEGDFHTLLEITGRGRKLIFVAHPTPPFWFKLTSLSYFNTKRCHHAGGSLGIFFSTDPKSLWCDVPVCVHYAHTYTCPWVCTLPGVLNKPCFFTHLPLCRVFIDWWTFSKHPSLPCIEFVLYLFIYCWICASSHPLCLVFSLSLSVVVNYSAWKDWGPNLWHDDTQ